MKTLGSQERERLKPLLMKFAEECISSWDGITGVDIAENDENKTCFVVYSKKRLPKFCRRVEEYDGITVCWLIGTPNK